MISKYPIRAAWQALRAALLLTALGGSALAADDTQTVRLTIDYGDGVQKTFLNLEWKEKLTVFDALKAAEKHPRGIKIEHSGSGETIFIKNDAPNEGQGGRNWRYSVNGEGGKVSAGIAELKPGDQIVWRYVR
jgi:hypothetical protein